MEREDWEEGTMEGIREEFHERVEKLRGQARDLKDFLAAREDRDRARSRTELANSVAEMG